MKRKASGSSPSKTADAKRKKVETKSEVSFDSFVKNIEKKRNKHFTNNYSFNMKRVRFVRGGEDVDLRDKHVLYWMSRDQRVDDNWALIFAQKLALKSRCRLHVCFCLVPTFLDANIRHYEFMMKGLELVDEECRNLNIPFNLLLGPAKDVIPHFVLSNHIGAVITDFSPLRLPRQWVTELSDLLPPAIMLCQVDTHNVVPVWQASPKLEVGARTIRSKINKQLPEYLTEFPPIIKHPGETETNIPRTDWQAARLSLRVDMSVKEVSEFRAGYENALKNLWEFIHSRRLVEFNKHRNNPTKSCLSNISPWLHFGQISAQRCVLEVLSQKSRATEGVDIFVEEALVRRELADNFCFYNEHYDSVLGASQWAVETLEVHRHDERPYKYSMSQLETGTTHDRLWNAAQLQMVADGKMHGFLRMYWAKKILEWTAEGPEEALRRAIVLNDRYSLDGRDPNGYTGIMWSICGVHDQGWRERPIFGKVRYMNYEGCKRKFDVQLFEDRYRRTASKKNK